MRSRILVSALLVLGVFAAGAVATSGDAMGSQKRWAIVNFVDPVQVKDQILMGPCLIVHDDAKMARGEPCTTIYRFDRERGPQQELVSFMCKPSQRDIVSSTRLTTLPTVYVGISRLTEYQFAGDTESHGVPAIVH